MKKINSIILFIGLLLASSITHSQTVFSDGFEIGLAGNWSMTGTDNLSNPIAPGNSSLFKSSSTFFKNGSKSAYCNLTLTNAESIMTLQSNLNLTTLSSAVFSFYHIAQTEAGASVAYDKCYVEVSQDGGATWAAIPGAYYQGTSDYGTRGFFDENSYKTSPNWKNNGSPVAPGGSWWVQESFNFTAYVGQNDIKVRYRYTTDGGTNEWGWSVDDVIIEKPLTSSYGSQNCASNLSYSYPVTISDMGGATSVKITDGTTNYYTSISSTGTYTINSISGAKTISIVDESNGRVYSTSSVSACPCSSNGVTVTFGAQNCGSNLVYSVPVNITGIGSGVTVKVTDGTTNYFTGISSTGSVTVSGLSSAKTIYVTDESSTSCSLSQAFSACNICSISDKPTDECVNAPLIDLSQPFYGSTKCSYTASASSPVGCGSIENDSYMKFVAGANNVKIDITIQTAAANCNTGVQYNVFSGSCGSLVAVSGACVNPSSTPNVGSTINWNLNGLTIGATYYLRIDGYAGDKCDYYFTPISGVVVTPPNDLCADAITLTCGGPTDTVSNIFATATGKPTACSGGGTTAKGVWYKVTGNGGAFTVTTNYATTNFDTELNVYSGTCASLVCISANDNISGANTKSSVTFATTNGVDYYIYLDGNGTSEGTAEIGVTCATCSPISITSQSTNGQNACQNGTFTSISATVTGTNPTYKWYSNNSASNTGGTFIPSATNSSYTPLATTSGTLYYYCVVTGDCGSDTTSISGAFVVSPTTVGGTVSSNESICSGSSPSDLSLTGNVGSVTKWQKSTNTSFTGAVDIANTTTTLTGASIGNLTTTTYFRAVVQSGTCPIANSAYVTITIDPTSVGGTVSSDQSICSGSSPSDITLSGNVGNVTKWQSANNTSFTGAIDIANTTTTLTGVSIGNLTTTTYFRAEVQSGSCPVATSSYLTVTVSNNLTPSVSISSSDLDNIVCENSSVTFTPTPNNGGGSPTYQWYVNGILKGSSNSYTATLTDQDVVSCILHSNSGCLASNDVTSNTITTAVNPLPVISSLVSNTTICAGNTFTVNGTSSNATNYWSTLGSGTFNNSNALSTFYTPSVTDINAGTVGLYLHADGQGACLGQNISQRVDLTFNTANSPVVSLGNDTTICAVNAYTANGIASNGSIQWTSSGSGTFNNVAINNPIYTPSSLDTAAGSVKLKMIVTGATGVCNGFSKSDSLVVSFNKIDAPKIDAGSNATICAVSTYTTNGVKNLGTAQWTSSGTGTFTNGTSLAATYKPSNADTTAGSVKLYLTVTGTANQCLSKSAKDSLVLTFNNVDAPKIDAGSNATICAVSSYTTNGVKNLGTAQWTTSGTGSFTNGTTLTSIYTPSTSDTTAGSVKLYLTVTGTANQCLGQTAKDSLVLTFDKISVPKSYAGVNSSICAQTNYTASATATNANSIKWASNGTGTFQNDAIEDAIYVPSVSDVTVGQVTLTMQVNGGGNCISAHPTSNIVLTINKLPTAAIIGSSSICIGSNAPVVFTGTPNAIVSYNLNGGSNQTITLSNSGSASFMSNNVNADQTFNLVSVTNASTGCNLNTSSSINIIVVAYPLAPNVSNDTTYCEQDNIDLLTAQANGGGVLKWYSDAALTDSIGTGISFNPNYFTSSYYVTETNLIGCESLPSVINITVNKCEVKVPSAFTPDGDGVNDNWELEHLDLIYPKNVVKIFNRWGNVVFESTAGGYEKHPWDGKIKQDDLPVASYYYIIEYNDAKTESVKGIVTIIRK